MKLNSDKSQSTISLVENECILQEKIRGSGDE